MINETSNAGTAFFIRAYLQTNGPRLWFLFCSFPATASMPRDTAVLPPAPPAPDASPPNRPPDTASARDESALPPDQPGQVPTAPGWPRLPNAYHLFFPPLRPEIGTGQEQAD